MMIQCHINSRGFTLLEILIAIAIFAAISAVLYPSYTGTFRNIEAAQSQSEIYQMARVTLERITEDLQSAFLHGMAEGSQTAGNELHAGFLGRDFTLNGKNADELRFTSEQHIIFNENDRRGRGEIAYYVKESEDKEVFSLYRSDTLIFDNQPDEGTGGFVICDGLYSINFQFQNDEGETYDNWDSSVEPFKDKLPVMISIKIEWSDPSVPDSVIPFMTSVALPMAKNK
jgi:type II secretion system protein J